VGGSTLKKRNVIRSRGNPRKQMILERKWENGIEKRRHPCQDPRIEITKPRRDHMPVREGIKGNDAFT